ncbi:hypothetical protein CTEN210_06288 [Chaetoceros tenuissimus]|uniref:Disease resistance R13L4/SHOC-2-like LRR domain-containing protein n=1 Tax=Chaetoceros tenuissimus TaxID=426638 RepID=A0AAD3CPK7_9STRA|nr:hypothetical protein CTEN210_06288 [Chaetoceros tenuissimus]
MDRSTKVGESSALSSVLSTFLKKKNNSNLIDLLNSIKSKSDFVYASRYLTQESLSLNSSRLKELPTSFKAFSMIKWLDLCNNQLHFVDAVFSCSELETLLLRNNQLSSFPLQVKLLRKLRLIDLSENNLVEVSIEVLELPALAQLLLDDNLFQRFQSSITNKFVTGDLKDFQEVKDPYTGENVFFNRERGVALKSMPKNSNGEKSTVYNLQKSIKSQLLCLSLSGNNLREIPVECMVELEDVNLSNNELTSIKEVLKLPKLKKLNLSKNSLCEIKNEFQSCRLESVDLSENKFKAFPLSLLKLSKTISFLNLEGNSITSIPDDVGFMQKLQSLNLRGNNLDESLTTRDTPTVLWQLRESALTKKNGDVPKSKHLEDEINFNEAVDEALEAKELCLRNFTLLDQQNFEISSSLERIDLSFNLYVDKFAWPKALHRLQKLAFNSCNLSSIPFSLERLARLKQLELKNNRLEELPKEIGNMNELSILDVSCNMLQEIPKLNCRKLRNLFLDSNRISSLEPLRQCRWLEVLSVSNNKIRSVNNTLSDLEQLRELNISHNDISGDLSIDFGIMKLEKMNLSHNRIVQLEDDFFTPSLCASLEVLHLEGNELVVLPQSLRDMERLRHLNLDMNPLESPPLSLCCEGAGTIVKYMELRHASIASITQFVDKALHFVQIHFTLVPQKGGLDETKYLLAFQYVSPQGPVAKIVKKSLGKQNRILVLRKVILSEEESEREKFESKLLEKYFEKVLTKFVKWKQSRSGARSLQAETNHRLRLAKSQLKRKRKELVIARANASDRIKALQGVKSEEDIVAVKNEMDMQI